MGLKKINDRVFYYPHQPETDRPMLAYLKGDKIALAVDAGNSADHVDEFYKSLEVEGLRKPDITVITHWHWDHTFGMHHIHGLSLAHHKTNEFLESEKAKLSDNAYMQFLKKDDKCLNREYANNKEIVIALSDIQFEKELTLNLGGITAKVFHAESPHSEDTVLIYVPEEKILFLGDSTSEDYFNNGYMDKDKLKALNRLIECTDCQYCILGHTDPLTKSDLLDYLKSILS
ncbi:MBL fold metallo-hydrolase [Desulfotomaculum sp. 1211_IL3151]|uniref:MBL fold metallo-hydrolase n=1 Tax=Desulfotomaculum sp. 1211_IL3151 TaxID=3084055 RepID=UPI002FDA57DD